MIKRLKAMLEQFSQNGPATGNSEETLRIATAALLMEAACMDGQIDEAEQATITDVLIGQFGLNRAEALELAEAGRQAVASSNELYKFTRTIKDNLEHDERVKIIEMLWQVAYADGHLHDYEANLVRRVCGLIYVSDQESGQARKRVLERLDLTTFEAS